MITKRKLILDNYLHLKLAVIRFLSVIFRIKSYRNLIDYF